MGARAWIGIVLALGVGAVARTQPTTPLAIVGATIVDGNGGTPVRDGVVVIRGTRIEAAGARGSVQIPADAKSIEAAGRFIVPGFIDTNVHLSLYGGIGERYETLVRYHARQQDIVLEAAQLQLKHGVTTVRDSYGMLRPLVAVRDAVAAGKATGPRILAAGNIVGWGGPYSVSFSLIPERGLTLFQEQVNDEIAQGVGEDLVDMDLSELRAAIEAYLDKGPDFLKYGGTAHFRRPAFIGFSPEAQKVIVDAAHKRNRVAETHATTIDGLRLSLEAGVDLIQHPEMLGTRDLPDPLVRTIVERKIVCSILSNTVTGDAWQKHLKDRKEAERKRAEEEQKGTRERTDRTTAERRQRESDMGQELEARRRNARRLIAAGAIVTIGTDNYWAAASELSRTSKPNAQNHGVGSLIAIEGLVELGMTPMQAIIAATRNGAVASRGLPEFGTVEAGKRADLLVLDGDPLADIRNIRKLVTVIRDGIVIDRERLPEQRVLSRPPVTPPTSSAR